MNSNIENLYRLQDGTQADPKDCEKGKDGVLRHKNGLAVVLKEDGEPQTLGHEAASNTKLMNAAQHKTEEAKPEDKPKDEPAKPAVREPEVRREAHSR